MICVEDYLDALRWADGLGGLPALIARSQANLAVLAEWVDRTPWVEFLAADPAQRSSTSICLKLTAPWFLELDGKARTQAVEKLSSLLAAEGVAYDINAYRSAPPGLRIWGGATVESADLKALLPWLEWAYAQVAPV
jgi:phosphoserine aminotransferase